MDADEALETLLEGNDRFMEGAPVHPNSGKGRRREVIAGQTPFAAVMACSDSRVPPEMVFDVGIGDLFVVRTAGNVADEAALGSIEYAVGHLGVPFVLVMGHTFCGAVTAAVEGSVAAGHVASIVRAIAPAVGSSRGEGVERVHRAVIENVRLTASSVVERSDVVRDAVAAGRVRVAGAVYDLETGEVLLLDR